MGILYFVTLPGEKTSTWQFTQAQLTNRPLPAGVTVQAVLGWGDDSWPILTIPDPQNPGMVKVDFEG
jgi:hypothetical protein